MSRPQVAYDHRLEVEDSRLEVREQLGAADAESRGVLSATLVDEVPDRRAAESGAGAHVRTPGFAGLGQDEPLEGVEVVVQGLGGNGSTIAPDVLLQLGALGWLANGSGQGLQQAPDVPGVPLGAHGRDVHLADVLHVVAGPRPGFRFTDAEEARPPSDHDAFHQLRHRELDGLSRASPSGAARRPARRLSRATRRDGTAAGNLSRPLQGDRPRRPLRRRRPSSRDRPADLGGCASRC